jgi:ribulose-phosphate 3-epimerase
MLSASVACVNPLGYRETVRTLEAHGIDGYHFDFCDGHFAHTLQLSPVLVKALRGLTSRRFDVHLYCTHPSRYIEELEASGADLVVVQAEADEEPGEVVRLIRRRGMKAGLGILPGSAVPENVEEIFPHLQLIIANTVGPAYAGQPFDERGLENLRVLRSLIAARGHYIELGVDGNVSAERLDDMLGAGANHLVCGTSSIFRPGTDAGVELAGFRRQVARACAGLSS